MFVGDDPCNDVCLDKAINDDTVSEHHTVIRLAGDKEGQAAVVAVCVSGINKFCCDDYFLSLCTAENRFQISSQHWDLVIDGVHLEMIWVCPR